MSLQDVLNILQGASGGIEQVKAGVSEQQSNAIQALQDQLDIVNQIGQNNEIIARQQEQGLLQAQRNTRAAATALGTNMDDGSELLTQLGRIMRDSAAVVINQKRKVDTLAEGVASYNPLAIIRDIFTGDQERAKLANAESTFNETSAAFNALNTATQSVARTQESIAQTKSEATVAAQAEIQKLNAANIEAQIRGKMAATNVDALLQINNLNSQQMDYAVKGYQLQVQAEQHEWARQQKEIENKLRSEKLQDDADFLNIVNEGARAVGVPEISQAMLKRSIQLDKESIARLYKIGASKQLTGTARISDEPLEALGIVQSTGFNLSETQKNLTREMTNSLRTATPQEMIELVYPNATPQERIQLAQDKKRLPEIQNEYLKRTASIYASKIDPEDGTNWYQLGTLNTIKNERYLRENPFLKEVVLPQAIADTPVKFNPSQLFKVALEEGIKGGKYQTEDIVNAITWIGQKLKLQNNISNNYLGFGIPQLDQINMPINVQVSSFRSVAGTFDVSDPVEVRSVIANLVSQQAKSTNFIDRVREQMFERGSNASGIFQ